MEELNPCESLPFATIDFVSMRLASPATSPILTDTSDRAGWKEVIVQKVFSSSRARSLREWLPSAAQLRALALVILAVAVLIK